MTTDLAHRKDLILRARDFERQCKVAGLFAILRQWGVMQYGPATPSPAEDLISIERLSVFGRYKVLSGDQIKLRKSREVPILQSDELEHDGARVPLPDRQVYSEWLCSTFE